MTIVLFVLMGFIAIVSGGSLAIGKENSPGVITAFAVSSIIMFALATF